MAERQSIPMVVVLNTLGGALDHYTKALVSVLEARSVPVEVVTLFEPSVSGSRARWVARYLQLLLSLRGRRKQIELVVTWPVIGYLDLVLVRVLFGPGANVVIHDTKPLVMGIGYDKISMWLAACIRTATLLIHSEQARADIDNAKLNVAAYLLPLPILEPKAENEITAPRQAIRVVGQFKPDRDIEGLIEIANQLGEGAVLEVVGRRWPDISGWKVTDAFVSESELDRLIQTSSVVVIPYKRFYQSDIAIRCLEASTPIVGPAGTSLDGLLGQKSKALVNESVSWADATAYAASEAGRVAVSDAAAAWRQKCLEEWSIWARQ